MDVSFQLLWSRGPGTGQDLQESIEADYKTLGQIGWFPLRQVRHGPKTSDEGYFKDFKISKRKVKLNVHPTEKTTNLSISVPKLLGGTATVVYILGQKSKELVQINVMWGLGVDKNVEGENVVNTANMLRDHFLKKRYKKETMAVNAKLTDSKMVVFRGEDEKNRMVLMVLTKQKKEKKESTKEAAKKISLRLSYMLNFDKPDVFSIKEGEF